MKNKESYRALCEEESSIPIFSQAWWLDTVCGEDNWGACIVTKNENVIASMPYYIKKRYGLTFLSHPPLTQKLGPWFANSKVKYTKLLANQKEYSQKLIRQLPSCSYFSQNWHYKNTNWLPFHWNGFQQTTRYTYIIKDLKDERVLWERLQGNVRTDIKKAINRFQLTVDSDANIDDFLLLNRLTFERQGISPPYSETLVKKIHQACKRRNACKIFIARDPEGKVHGGAFTISDNTTTYYIMGGADPKLRSSGAQTLCIWEAIKHASQVTAEFDFEGSMIESIEKFNRAFGAVQVPYFNIYKANSLLVKAALMFKK